jgi:hypothetical protein
LEKGEIVVECKYVCTVGFVSPYQKKYFRKETPTTNKCKTNTAKTFIISKNSDLPSPIKTARLTAINGCLEKNMKASKHRKELTQEAAAAAEATAMGSKETKARH